MDKFNFDNKRFVLIQNSDNGQVNRETIFEYKQDNNLVTADYFGGTVRYGKIIAELSGDELNMLYQCLTTDNQLKAGKAIAKISLTDSGKMKLSLNWEWLTNGNEKGQSEYIEIDQPQMNNNRHKIDIVAFSDEQSESIRTLNYEWLEKYFRVEDGDVISLSNPKEHIINKGGFIFYAKLNDEIVGTASLLKKTDSVFELGKMAVTESAQGHRIGTALLEHCIAIAKQKRIKTLILYSNTKLESAIHL